IHQSRVNVKLFTADLYALHDTRFLQCPQVLRRRLTPGQPRIDEELDLRVRLNEEEFHKLLGIHGGGKLLACPLTGSGEEVTDGDDALRGPAGSLLGGLKHEEHPWFPGVLL